MKILAQHWIATAGHLTRYGLAKAGFLTAILCFFMSGCGRQEGTLSTTLPENEAGSCLNMLCPGEAEPPRDPRSEAAFKVGGQWFVGPKSYYSVASKGAVIWWPSKNSMEMGPGTLPIQADAIHAEIEIFLRYQPSPPNPDSWWDDLLQAEKEDRVLSKITMRDGLEEWQITAPDVLQGTVWYAAIALTGATGDPPVVSCLLHDHPEDRCTGGFRIEPTVTVDFRFNARHRQDWPDIYQEIVRVLSLLRKG